MDFCSINWGFERLSRRSQFYLSRKYAGAKETSMNKSVMVEIGFSKGNFIIGIHGIGYIIFVGGQGGGKRLRKKMGTMHEIVLSTNGTEINGNCSVAPVHLKEGAQETSRASVV